MIDIDILTPSTFVIKYGFPCMNKGSREINIISLGQYDMDPTQATKNHTWNTLQNVMGRDCTYVDTNRHCWLIPSIFNK